MAMPPTRQRPESDASSAILALIRGRVQGVGFRYEARSQAKALGLTGWIQNLPDGGVELWAEGTVSALDRFQRWLQKGPPGANVESVDCSIRAARGTYRSFTIEY